MHTLSIVLKINTTAINKKQQILTLLYIIMDFYDILNLYCHTKNKIKLQPWKLRSMVGCNTLYYSLFRSAK